MGPRCDAFRVATGFFAAARESPILSSPAVEVAVPLTRQTAVQCGPITWFRA